MTKFNLDNTEVRRILMLHENQKPNNNYRLLTEGTLGSYTTKKLNAIGGYSGVYIPINTTFTEVQGKPNIVRATNITIVDGYSKPNKDYPEKISISYYCNQDKFFWSHKLPTGQQDTSEKNVIGQLRTVLKQNVCYKSKESNTSNVVKSKSYFLSPYTKGAGDLKIFQGTTFVKKTDQNGKPYLITSKVSVQEPDSYGNITIDRKSEIKYFCDTKTFGLNLAKETGFESTFTSPNTRWYDSKKGLSTKLNKLCTSTDGTSEDPVKDTGTTDMGTKNDTKTEKTDQQNLSQVDNTGNKTETNTDTKTSEVQLVDFIVPVFPGTSTKVTDNQQGEQPTVF
jgi:hypothetical protein